MLMAESQGKSREKLISDTVWRKNKESIRKNLSIRVAFDFLVQAKIVPQDAQEAYVDLQTEVDKRNRIIDSIPKCEQYDYLLRFIECLKNTYKEAGKAHEDLVKLLEGDYEETKKEMKNDSTTRTCGAALNGAALPPPVNSSQPTASQPPEVSLPSKSSRALTALKMNWRWVVAYSASLIWLVLGIIVAVVLSQVPQTRTSLPVMITGRRDALMAEVDLGIDPFWISSASFRLTTVGQQQVSPCTAGLYVLTNQTCQTLPMVTQEFDMNNLLASPFYLLEGSTFNITLGAHNDSVKEFIDVWYVESTTTNCDRVFGDCEQPPRATYTCQRGLRGETLPVYRVNNSEYYAFCSDQLFRNSFILKSITYNVSAIRQMYTPRTPLTTNENAFTVDFSQSFDFSAIDYCILLDVDRNQCPSSTSASYRLNIELKQRMDIPLLSFIIGGILFAIHFVITIIVHSCFRKCHRKNSGDLMIN
ncbi:uncharacterized protein LOC135337626 isoform X2 [Halichondria panicea]|uniref:uncharacterized protein LOC135337626 isoform X2 n=1 Tax=Halichondria panicea TaxID=6063 RepID=UPI00312B624F